MSRCIVIVFALVFSGCQIFNIGSGMSRKNLKTLSLYTTIEPENSFMGGAKIKTRINIFKDSVLISASVALGIELARIKITNTRIYIDQKIQNKQDSIMILSLDPKFKLKTIKKLIVSKKPRHESIHYSNPYMSCTFANYTEKNKFFLPEKITLSTKTEFGQTENSFNIEYKKIIF